MRKAQKRANIEKIRELVIAMDTMLDYTPIIAYVMKHSGCTYKEIADCLGLASAQLADYYVQAIEKRLD